MNRFLYTLLLTLALPFVPLKLLWRGIKQPSYLQHWAERFGFYSQSTKKPVICIHCVSVGETRAAAPLIKALQLQYPDHQILITHATPTGRETSEALFGDTVLRAYLPYDVPFSVNRFLKYFRPTLILLMETELWFNLIHLAHQQHTPTLLINARLSEKSAKGYAKLGQFVQQGLQQLSTICAQTASDAKRFEALDAQAVSVTGNLKFDVEVPSNTLKTAQTIRQYLPPNKKILVVASTREGEEALILTMLTHLPADVPFFTIIVPRHPQRFAEVAALIERSGLQYTKRSTLDSAVAASTQVLLGDSMGELFSYYAAADLAFVGGSLLPFGGQNLIEPCAVGTPVLIGPHTYNFAQFTEEAIVAGAVKRVADIDDLAHKTNYLLNETNVQAADSLAKMQQACLRFVAEKTGATENTMQVIKQFL